MISMLFRYIKYLRNKGKDDNSTFDIEEEFGVFRYIAQAILSWLIAIICCFAFTSGLTGLQIFLGILFIGMYTNFLLFLLF